MTSHGPPAFNQMIPPSYHQPQTFHHVTRGGYHGGSLPRRSQMRMQPLGGQHQVAQKSHQVGRKTPVHLMERSQSAVPFLHQGRFSVGNHHRSHGHLHQPFVTSQGQPRWAQKTQAGYSENNLSNGTIKTSEPSESKSDVDKSRNVQDQFSKLQRMQSFHKQRNVMNNKQVNGNIQQAVYMSSKT